MYEFNGWAVVISEEANDAADDALFERLKAHVATLPESTRDRIFFPATILNGHWSIAVSGLRNHPDGEIRWLFEWLGEQSRRCYGLLHTRDDEWGDSDRFDVWKLERGAVTLHEDPFFT